MGGAAWPISTRWTGRLRSGSGVGHALSAGWNLRSGAEETHHQDRDHDHPDGGERRQPGTRGGRARHDGPVRCGEHESFPAAPGMGELGEPQQQERRKDPEEKEGKQENLVSDLEKEVEEIPGLKEAKEIRDTAKKVKNITRFLR